MLSVINVHWPFGTEYRFDHDVVVDLYPNGVVAPTLIFEFAMYGTPETSVVPNDIDVVPAELIVTLLKPRLPAAPPFALTKLRILPLGARRLSILSFC